MKRAFSLIELLVACLLLSMLMTILTMVFNQSSLAWRTGTAGVARLDKSRRQLGAFHDARDNALPGLEEEAAPAKSRSVKFRSVSIYQPKSNNLRTGRAYDQIKWGTSPEIATAGDTQQGKTYDLESGDTAGGGTFTVGVRSAGPNREFGDEDDITTWPDEVF